MPRKRNASAKWTTGKVLYTGIALMFVALFIFGGPLQYIFDTYGPDWVRTKPGELDPDAKQVDLSVRVSYMTSGGVPGTARNVDIYDANKVHIERATSDTTTGLVQFQEAYWEGETVWVQVYVVPATAAGISYTTNLVQLTVPNADVNGDAQLTSIKLAQPATSTANPTMVVHDFAGAVIDATASNYINNTDTGLRLTVDIVTADRDYGQPEDFVDMWTGFSYKAGLWVLVTTNHSIEFSGYSGSFTEGLNYYYYWTIPMESYLAGDINTRYFTVSMSAITNFDWGAAAGTNTTLSIDIFDCVRLSGTGGINAASFLNFDTDFQMAVLTTYIHV